MKMQASPGVCDVENRTGDFLCPIWTLSFVTLEKSPLHPRTTGLSESPQSWLPTRAFWDSVIFYHETQGQNQGQNQCSPATSAECPCRPRAPCLPARAIEQSIRPHVPPAGLLPSSQAKLPQSRPSLPKRPPRNFLLLLPGLPLCRIATYSLPGKRIASQ